MRRIFLAEQHMRLFEAFIHLIQKHKFLQTLLFTLRITFRIFLIYNL